MHRPWVMCWDFAVVFLEQIGQKSAMQCHFVLLFKRLALLSLSFLFCLDAACGGCGEVSTSVSFSDTNTYSLYRSVCLSVCLSGCVYVSISLPSLVPFLLLSACLSVCLFVCLSVCLSVWLAEQYVDNTNKFTS